MSIYRRVLQYYRPFLLPTVFALFLTLCGIALNLLKPWPFKIIVDDILPAFTRRDYSGQSYRPDIFGLHVPTMSVTAWVAVLCLALVLLQFVGPRSAG